MTSLLVFLALILTAPIVLVRVLILFPIRALSLGWPKALYRYRISLALAAMLLVYETGNLTGFSWERRKYVGAAELGDAAVKAAYSPTYQNLAELQADYPGFSPEIRYWNGWNIEFQDSVFAKLIGLNRYQVRLPDTIAILDTSGRAVTQRGCDTDPCLPWVLPRHPAIGVIAAVQLGEKPYDIVTDYEVQWSDGTTDGILRMGHCFSAWREGAAPSELIVSRKGAYPMKLHPGQGYFLIGLQMMSETTPSSMVRGVASQSRLAKADFLYWKTCDATLRHVWPNLGHWWKR
jgi:hypothetical protein